MKIKMDVCVISYLPTTKAGKFPKSYFIKQYECADSDSSFNPKNCRGKKALNKNKTKGK
jgi:hypothetical protein